MDGTDDMIYESEENNDKELDDDIDIYDDMETMEKNLRKLFENSDSESDFEGF